MDYLLNFCYIILKKAYQYDLSICASPSKYVARSSLAIDLSTSIISVIVSGYIHLITNSVHVLLELIGKYSTSTLVRLSTSLQYLQTPGQRKTKTRLYCHRRQHREKKYDYFHHFIGTSIAVDMLKTTVTLNVASPQTSQRT